FHEDGRGEGAHHAGSEAPHEGTSRMSPIQSTRTDHNVEVSEIRIPGFEISWAGQDPWNRGFCFGSEDGRIKFTKVDSLAGQGPFSAADSGEAINGVAFTNDVMAVSTRSEVAFWSIPYSEKASIRFGEYDGGAHDVISTDS